MASDNGKSFLDKFAEVSAKVGNQVHLLSLIHISEPTRH